MSRTTVGFWGRNNKIYSRISLYYIEDVWVAPGLQRSKTVLYFECSSTAKKTSRTCVNYNCRWQDLGRPEAPAEHFHACFIIQQPSGGIWVLASCSLRSPQLINCLHPTWVTCLVFTHFEHRLSQNQGASYSQLSTKLLEGVVV